MNRNATCSPLFCISVCLVSLLASAADAAAIELDGWHAEGTGAEVAGSGGMLRVEYQSPRYEKIVLRPVQPIALPADAARVGLWCARVEGDFDVCVLLRDASGHEHALATTTSRPEFPAIRRSKMREWSVWRQVESVSFGLPDRIENRVQPEFVAIAQKTVWPGPVTLAGIEIRPVKERRDNEAYPDNDAIQAGRGKLWLAELAFGPSNGLRAKYNWFFEGRWRWGWDTRPCLFPDDLTRRPGKTRHSIAIRGGYQGPVVWCANGSATTAGTEAPALFAQRIELPELPAGRYFVETKTWLADGTLDRTETMKLWVIAGGALKSGTPSAAAAWETGQPHHVFPAATTTARLLLKVPAAAWPEASSQCSVRIVDWRGRVVGESRHDRAEAVTVECSGLHEGTDYFATAEWRAGSKVLDRVRLHFGVANGKRARSGEPGSLALPSRDELLMSHQPTAIAEHWGAVLASEEVGETLADGDIEQVDQWLASLPGLGFRMASFHFGWGEAEPLPGVFRWEEIERRVELAEKLGLKVFLTPAAWGTPLEWPRWLDFQPMTDQFGHVLSEGRSGVLEPAVSDPIRKEGQPRWLRAVAERFLDSPTVIGYRTKPVIFLADNRPQFARSDYSSVTQQGFTRWLVEKGKPGTPAPPLFAMLSHSPSRTGPDLSPAWQDFMAFRTHAYAEAVQGIVAGIRSVDRSRQIHVYRSSVPNACEAAIPLLADGAEFHDEGGPFYFQRAIESMCLQAGIPYTNEGHQFTPPSRAMADAGFFYGSIYDRGWCWLYRWNQRRHEDPRFASLPEVLSFIRDSQPALREWVGATGDPPEVLVFGSRADRLLGGARHGFYSDIAGVDAFTALFTYHQLPAHFADEYTDWIDLRKFKCVLAVGEILTERAVTRLAQHVRRGGRVVLVGDVGKFCPERPTQRDVLRKQLVGLPNLRTLSAPDQPTPAPGPAFRAEQAFSPAAVDDLLAWAGVRRRVQVETPGFECLRKLGGEGRFVYVAVFRRYPASYENIWYDQQVEQRWGRQPARVKVVGLENGKWHVEKFHRTARSIAHVSTQSGDITFDTDPATVGELQLFRLTRE